jgi:hypothetical protein
VRIDAAAEFGVLADGTSDNAAALLAMRSKILARPDEHHPVAMPAGEVRYSNNRWLMGVQRVTLEAYGTTFVSTDPGPWFVNRQPFNVGDVFNDTGDAPHGPGSVFVTGERIAGAASGATKITFLAPDAAKGYAAGQRVLVHGFDQQFTGYPFNLRYFDYRAVAEVLPDGLSLTVPLAHSYDGRWPDTVYPDFYSSPGIAFGAPRVLRLDRGAYAHPRYLRVLGASFPGIYYPSLPGDEVIYEDCEFGTAVAGMSRRTTFRRCSVSGELEVDKLLGGVLVEDCAIGGALAAASGCDRLTVLRCRLGEVRAMPRHLSIEDCDIIASAYFPDGAIRQTGSFPIDTLRISGNRVYAGFDLAAIVDDGGDHALAALRLPAGGAEARAAFQTLDIGTAVEDGVVTALYEDKAAGEWVIEGTWTATGRWSYRMVRRVVDAGGNDVVGRRPQ